MVGDHVIDWLSHIFILKMLLVDFVVKSFLASYSITAWF